MTFEIGRVLAEVQILKKVILLQNDIGRGFAERQILKKVKMALSLELSGIY